LFGRPCYEVHGACDNRINLYPAGSDPACQGAACMDDRAGGMGLIFRTADWQVPICDADPASLRASATIMMRLPVLPFGPLHKPLGNRALGLMFDPQPSHLDRGRPHRTAARARDPLRALHLAAVIGARSQSQKACDLSSVAELTIVDFACHDRGTGRTDAF